MPDSYLNYLAPAVKQTDNLKVPEVSLIATIVAVSKKGVNKTMSIKENAMFDFILKI